MSWEKRNILLVVKTYPERSQKYGNTVCTAGILEDTEEFIRIYPINFQVYYKKKLQKFVRFEAKVQKDTKDYLGRKESYKINESSIHIIDDSLTKTHKKGVWDERMRILSRYTSKSMEELRIKFDNDRTSLGLVKPLKDSLNFTIDKPVEDIEIDIVKKIQLNLLGEKIKPVDKIEKAFYYKFKCNDENCNGHKKICEDWELLEAFRKWRKRYQPRVLEEKLREKFLDNMVNKTNFHFFVGTYWKYPVWLIIGLFYPPKQKIQNKMTNYISL